VARDGVLPASGWVSRVSAEGQPKNAVLVVWGVAAVITCTILPSAVAFTSLVSAAGVPSAAAYGLISLGRLFLTPNEPLDAKWSLGRLSKPFQVISVFWNGWVVAVLFSPYSFPVEASTLNCEYFFLNLGDSLGILIQTFRRADYFGHRDHLRNCVMVRHTCRCVGSKGPTGELCGYRSR
jgi:amino acid transporter